MAYWGGGGAAGWSGDWMRGGRQGRTDGWDYEELGKVYDPSILRRLWPYIVSFRWQALTALAGMLLYSVTSYVQPFIMGIAVERLADTALTLTERREAVTVAGLLLVVLAAVSWVAQWAQRLLTGYIGQQLLFRLRRELFEHLNKLSLSFYDRQEVGRVMSRATSDVVVMQELMTSGFLNVLADLFGLALIVFFLFWLDPLLAVVSLSVIPVLLVLMAIWQRHAAQAFIRVRQAIAVVNSSINENVSGVRVVQSLGREEHNLGEFDQLNERNRDLNLRAGKLQAAVMPLVELLSAVATALVLVVIAMRVFGGSMEPAHALGHATAFTLYIQRFFNPVRDIVLQYTQLQRAMAGAHRVFEVLDTEPEIVDAHDAIDLPDVEGRVDFNGVGFEYVEGVPVLEDFELHVEPGETVAFVGHTGAGKTTVTALVSRSYDVTSGSITIDGTDLRRIRRESLRRRMAVVLQEPFLFSGTVAENIRYGRLDASDEEIRRAAAAVGAAPFIERLPEGYETELHERGQNLSVGQRQLIAFARAVVAEPRILVLDEATANVDTQTERTIQHALQVLLAGRTSFVIAHRLSTIRHADRIVVMDEGEIAEIGSHEELLERGGVYADLYRMTYERHAGDVDEDGLDDEEGDRALAERSSDWGLGAAVLGGGGD